MTTRWHRWGGAALLLVLTCTATALAQDTGGEAAAANVRYFDFFVVKGGWIAYLLIALSVVAMALAIEHALTIRRTTIVPPGVADHTRMLISQRRYLEAIQYTAEHPSMLGYLLHAALKQAPNGLAAMERAVEEALEDRAARLYRKIEYLNIIGSVSPMIGLFGTVVGMILLFAAIHASDAFPGARIVADRIAIALITTFWGLAVAIPSLAVFALFRNRIEVLAAECLLSAEHVLAVFQPSAMAPAPERNSAATVEGGNRESGVGEVATSAASVNRASPNEANSPTEPAGPRAAVTSHR
ncbi:MAG: MotA/TolQ/ExbB proton channel family protein [Phycisphaerae bacterium]|nr:MotA/TolQ/ExbB proton channel family protein [Phycisphaerae bacterium]